MRRATAALVLLAAMLLLVGARAGVAADGGSVAVAVELDRKVIDAGPGEKLGFVSTVRNTGERPVSGLIAHLNILTSDPDVYVDPEDWSPTRTQYLDDLAAGESTRLAWNVQAVTAGPLILYVAVTRPGDDGVAVSGPLQLTVGGQRVVNAGGVLPLALSVPGAVLALLGLTVVRRRQHR